MPSREASEPVSEAVLGDANGGGGGFVHQVTEEAESVMKDIVARTFTKVMGNMGEVQEEGEWDKVNKLWHRYRTDNGEPTTSCASHNFFHCINFAKDSGFSDIRNLSDETSEGGVSVAMRGFYAGLTVVYVVSNLIFLLDTDLFSSGANCEKGTIGPQGFLLSRLIMDKFWSLISTQNAGLNMRCQEQLVGYLELVGLSVLIFRALSNTFIVAFPTWFVSFHNAWLRQRSEGGKKGHKWKKDEHTRSQLRWFAMVRLLWENIPELCTFSGMKLLHFLQPWVVTKDMCWIAFNTEKEKQNAAWLWFFVTRCLAFVIGFDFFCVRFRVTIQYVTAEDLTIYVFFYCILFMKQVLGIVQVDLLVRERLVTFVFAGEDSILNSSERAAMQVWHAMLAEEIWKSSCSTWGPLAPVYFLILMMSYSAEDFQKLVLEPKEPGSTPRRVA